LPDHFTQSHEGNQNSLGVLVVGRTMFPTRDFLLKSGQDLWDSFRLRLVFLDPGELSSHFIDGTDQGGPAGVEDRILACT